jgi:alkanesulfonate monooxygenase SsuD/methylene tetrahydromethanopterin reductase-like flavin-dependent oxidoreductase (luciferase family)
MNLVPTEQAAPPGWEIPVFTAGVLPRMCEVAGRVSDRLCGHPVFTTTYIQEVVRTAIACGTEHTGRDPTDAELVSMVMCSVHDDVAVARRELAQQIAFYCSVKSYEKLLGLTGLTKEGAAIR